MKVFASILLAIWDDRLGLSKLVDENDQFAPFDLLNLSRQQLAHLVRELLPNTRTFPFAHTLNDALFGRLNRRAAKRLKRFLFLQHFARLEFRIFPPGFLQTDLCRRILHCLNDGA